MPIAPTVHDAAFRELVGLLMADGDLARRVTQWRRFSSDPDDPGDRDVLPADCPLVRLLPVGGSPATRLSSDGLLTTYAVPLGVQVETVVAARPGRGLDQSDALELSALILGALWPEDRTRRAAIDARFRAVGVADVRLVQPVLPVAYEEQFIGSRGLVELVQHVHL